jgi:hypothetical protein
MTNSQILLKAYCASAILRERQKSLAKEHSERRKKLLGLMEEINKVESTAGKQRDLAGVGLSLSPELSDLLENPLHGL